MLTIKFSDVGGDVEIIDITGNVMARGFLQTIEGDRDIKPDGNTLGQYGDIRLLVVVTQKFAPVAADEPLMATAPTK